MNELSKNIAISQGFGNSLNSKGNQSDKIIYTAIVRDNNDFSNMGRITAEIIDFDEKTGEVIPGKDRNDNTIKIAYPFQQQFLNTIPQVGEMVFIFLENPKDSSSRRFYTGPIRSVRKTVSEKESASSADELFNIDNFTSNQNNLTQVNNTSTVINKDYIFIQGKDDADMIFKSREVLIRAGSLKKNSFDKNIDTPCYVQLIQKSENSSTVDPFSQINIVGSNINLISSEATQSRNRTLDDKGKLIDKTNVEYDTNPRLNDYGLDAVKLHPLVFGDELIKVLKVIIKFCLNHKHTTQAKAYAPTEEIKLLNDFLSDENIQFILSKTVRTN